MEFEIPKTVTLSQSKYVEIIIKNIAFHTGEADKGIGLKYVTTYRDENHNLYNVFDVIDPVKFAMARLLYEL